MAILVMMICWTYADAGNTLQLAHHVEPEKIRTAVKNYIVRNAPWDSKQMRIKEIRFNHSIRVPSGRVTLEVEAPRHNDWIGATPFFVHVRVGVE